MKLFQSLIAIIFFISNRSVEAGYNDNVSCERFPEVANYSITELEEEAQRLGGQCLPYEAGSEPGTDPNPCNQFYEVGVDRFYLPSGRAGNEPRILYNFAVDTRAIVDFLAPECQEAATKGICYYYFPPCGNTTHFQPPNAVCSETCYYFTEGLCQEAWERALSLIQEVDRINNTIFMYNLQPPNCSQPGEILDSLPHCCSDAGIVVPDEPKETTSFDITSQETELEITAPPGLNLPLIIGASASAGVLVLLLTVVLVPVLCLAKKSRRRKNDITHFKSRKSKITAISVPPLPGLSGDSSSPTSPGILRYAPSVLGSGGGKGHLRQAATGQFPRVSSGFIRNMAESNLLIPGRHIHLKETIGQGEFGVVYRGHLTGWEGRTTAELVAVKTLKSSLLTIKDIDSLMKESEKMQRFRHPNVLNLIGVCIDAGEAPYIIMPYMANGSLLAYLRKKRPHLTIAEEAGEEMIDDAQRKLLSICLQIAKGMCYLAQQKFVHRDLAARNCMIDEHFVIKVADFGLSEDIYCRNYFRQGQVREEGATVKLPVKWMALESLLDGVFSEKTDVWSYGVTCWEVFSLGHTPYPAVDPFALVKFLRDGNRLDKPSNAACTQQVYDLIGSCWLESAAERPSFKALVVQMSALLKDLSGYLDLSYLSPPSGAGNVSAAAYDKLEKRFARYYDHLDD